MLTRDKTEPEMSELNPWGNMLFLRMRGVSSVKDGAEHFYGKLRSLRTMLTADFALQVETLSIFLACAKKNSQEHGKI